MRFGTVGVNIPLPLEFTDDACIWLRYGIFSLKFLLQGIRDICRFKDIWNIMGILPEMILRIWDVYLFQGYDSIDYPPQLSYTSLID